MLLLGLGSNIGNRLENIKQAILRINKLVGNIEGCSSLWETEPWGYSSNSCYYNAVCKIEHISMPLIDVLSVLLRIEKQMGRIRNHCKYEDRIIDIDILALDDIVLTTNNITIPHPKIHLRKFVLFPLKEVAPQWYHPVFKKTVDELIELCPDKGKIKNTGYCVL